MKILFAGDFAPCRGFENLLLDRGSTIFGDLREDIAKADLSFLNLETPLCTSGKPIKKTGPNLRAHPSCIKAVADAGFDVVGLANNHIMDFGTMGLIETLNACEKIGLVACGAGINLAESQKIQFIKKKTFTIALIAIAEHEFSIAGPEKPGAAPLDPIDNTLQIEQARIKADLVFVSIHGGNEYFPFPRPGLRKICRFYIDRGADAVICHHPHVPGAYELYEDKPIVYSLGNLIFDHSRAPVGWKNGYSILLNYSIDTKALSAFEIISHTQSVSRGGVEKMQGKQKVDFEEWMESCKRILSDDAQYAKVWTDFCKCNACSVLFRMFFPFQFRGLSRLIRFIPIEKLLLPKPSMLARENYIRCESHRELLSSILEEL